jgi:hypothetical protein
MTEDAEIVKEVEAKVIKAAYRVAKAPGSCNTALTASACEHCKAHSALMRAVRLLNALKK